MTFYTCRLLPTAVAVVLAAALSAAPSAPASAKKIDCARLLSLLQEQRYLASSSLYLEYNPKYQATVTGGSRALDGLKRTYDRNCQGFATEQVKRDALGEQVMQGILGAAIGVGGSYIGAGGRGHGHGPSVRSGGSSTGTTGAGGRHWR